MSDFYVKAQQQSVARATDGQWTALRATRDGAPIVLPWFQALVFEGRCFNITGPEFVTVEYTGMTLLALASFGDDDATIYADIPDGTAGIPLAISHHFKATGAAISHVLAFVSDTLLGSGGTETACTIRNLRRDSPVASAATAAHTATSETDHVTGAEVVLYTWHTDADIDATADFGSNFYWNAATNTVVPVVLDGGSISLNMAPTTSGTGFANMTWAELPESAFT